MNSVVLVCGRSADIEEFSFQPCKMLNMDCDGLLRGLFADCQEWHLLAANRSDKCSTVMKGLRFADSQESSFQASKRSNIGSAILVGG